MPLLELSDEQVVALFEQLPEAQKQRILHRLQNREQRPVPRFGILPGSVRYMAPDFDARLEDFREYME